MAKLPEAIRDRVRTAHNTPEAKRTAEQQTLLKEHGVLISPLGPQNCRACTHLDVSAADCERAAESIRKALRGAKPKPQKSRDAVAMSD